MWSKQKVVRYVTKVSPPKQDLSWGNLGGVKWHVCLMGRVCAVSIEMF